MPGSRASGESPPRAASPARCQAETDLSLLTDPDELGLIRKLSAYPSVLEGSAVGYEPHRMTYFLQQLAALLHTFYNKHRILPPAADKEVFEQAPAGIVGRRRVPNGSR